jgi:uncharacterized protein YdeI (BOF family)
MKMRSKALRGAAVVVAAVGCLVGLMVGVALATTISEATSAAPGTVVEVGGTLTLIEGNEYMLKDSLGAQIKIELGPVWYASYVLDSTQTYTFIGEVDKGKDGTAAAEIDVFTVKDAAGTTIAKVRDETGGKPPWAGGPHKNGQLPGAGVPDDDDAAGTPDSD